MSSWQPDYDISNPHHAYALGERYGRDAGFNRGAIFGLWLGGLIGSATTLACAALVWWLA